MGKSKPVPKVGAKKPVFTPGILKHVASYQRWKQEAATATKSSKSKKSKKDRQGPAKKKTKKNETPNHPLAVSFSTAIKNSRTHIKREVEGSIDSTYQDLKQRAASASARFDQTLQTMSTYESEILKPIGEDELQFTSEDGNSAGTQTVHDRMRQFKSIVEEESKELDGLQKQWMEVHSSIMDLAREALGPDVCLEDLLRDPPAPGNKLVDQIVTSHQKVTAEEIDNERRKWEEEIDKVNEAAMAKMRACEKEMDLLQRKQRINLLQLLNTDI